MKHQARQTERETASASHIRVSVRVRPQSQREITSGAAQCVGVSNNTITLVDPVSLELSAQLALNDGQRGNGSSAAQGSGVSAISAAARAQAAVSALGPGIPRRNLTFDSVFHKGHSQAHVFADVGMRVVDHAWAGYNASIFAYGQTGTGKSYTMIGGTGNSGSGSLGLPLQHSMGVTGNNNISNNSSELSSLGLIPRICSALFERAARAEAEQASAVSTWAAQRQSKLLQGASSTRNGGVDSAAGSTHVSYSMTVSLLEIYCERVRDLFALENALHTGSASSSSSSSSFSVGGVKKGGGGNGSNRRRSITSVNSSIASSSNASLVSSSGQSTQQQQQHLRVREHPFKGAFVEGLKEVSVKSYEEVEKLLVAGTYMRSVAETKMNESSSRSHAVFTLTFRQTSVDSATGAPLSERTSKVVLVDLAGSERSDASGSLSSNASLHGDGDQMGSHAATDAILAAQQRQREMTKINQSLSALGAVIKALSSRSGSAIYSNNSVDDSTASTFVPYRNSVLTWLLRDCLGGNSRTTMLATIGPCDVSYQETLSTLKYAESVKRVINAPVVNEGLAQDGTGRLVGIINELRAEVAVLRDALAANGAHSIEDDEEIGGKVIRQQAALATLPSRFVDYPLSSSSSSSPPSSVMEQLLSPRGVNGKHSLPPSSSSSMASEADDIFHLAQEVATRSGVKPPGGSLLLPSSSSSSSSTNGRTSSSSSASLALQFASPRPLTTSSSSSSSSSNTSLRSPLLSPPTVLLTLSQVASPKQSRERPLAVSFSNNPNWGRDEHNSAMPQTPRVSIALDELDDNDVTSHLQDEVSHREKVISHLMKTVQMSSRKNSSSSSAIQTPAAAIPEFDHHFDEDSGSVSAKIFWPSGEAHQAYSQNAVQKCDKALIITAAAPPHSPTYVSEALSSEALLPPSNNVLSQSSIATSSEAFSLLSKAMSSSSSSSSATASGSSSSFSRRDSTSRHDISNQDRVVEVEVVKQPTSVNVSSGTSAVANAALRDELRQLRALQDAARNENIALRGELERAKAAATAVSKDTAPFLSPNTAGSLQMRAQEAEKKYIEADAARTRMRSEVTAADSALNTAELAMQELAQRNSDLTERNRIITRENERLTNELKSALSERESASRDVHHEADALRRSLNAMNDKLSHEANIASQATNSLALLTQERDSLLVQLSNARFEAEEADEQAQGASLSLASERAMHAEAMASLRGELVRESQKSTSLRLQLSTQEESTKEREESLSTELNSARSALDDTISELNEARSRISSLEADSAALQELRSQQVVLQDHTVSAMQTARAEATSLKDSLAKAKADVERATRESAEAKREAEAARESTREMERDLDAIVAARMVSLETRLADTTAALERTAKDRDALHKEYMEATRRASEASLRLSVEAENAESARRKAEMELEEVRSANLKLLASIDAGHKTTHAHARESDSLRRESAELRNLLDTATARHKDELLTETKKTTQWMESARKFESDLDVIKDRAEQLAQTAAIATLQLRSAERDASEARLREVELATALKAATMSSDDSKTELSNALRDRSVAQQRVAEIESELLREKRHFESQVLAMKNSVADSEKRSKEAVESSEKLRKELDAAFAARLDDRRAFDIAIVERDNENAREMWSALNERDTRHAEALSRVISDRDESATRSIHDALQAQAQQHALELEMAATDHERSISAMESNFERIRSQMASEANSLIEKVNVRLSAAEAVEARLLQEAALLREQLEDREDEAAQRAKESERAVEAVKEAHKKELESLLEETGKSRRDIESMTNAMGQAERALSSLTNDRQSLADELDAEKDRVRSLESQLIAANQERNDDREALTAQLQRERDDILSEFESDREALLREFDEERRQYQMEVEELGKSLHEEAERSKFHIKEVELARHEGQSKLQAAQQRHVIEQETMKAELAREKDRNASLIIEFETRESELQMAQLKASESSSKAEAAEGKLSAMQERSQLLTDRLQQLQADFVAHREGESTRASRARAALAQERAERQRAELASDSLRATHEAEVTARVSSLVETELAAMRRDAAEAKVQWEHDKLTLINQIETATNRANRLQKQLADLASSKQQHLQQEQHYQTHYVRGGSAGSNGGNIGSVHSTHATASFTSSTAHSKPVDAVHTAHSKPVDAVHKDMLSLRRLSEDSMKQTQQLLESVHKLKLGDTSDTPLTTSLPPMRPRAPSTSNPLIESGRGGKEGSSSTDPAVHDSRERTRAFSEGDGFESSAFSLPPSANSSPSANAPAKVTPSVSLPLSPLASSKVMLQQRIDSSPRSPGVPETPGQRRRRLLLSVLSALERSTKRTSVDGSVGLLAVEDDEPGTIYSAKFAGSNHTQSVAHSGAGASSQAAHHSPESEEDERVGGGRNSIFASGKEVNKSLSSEVNKSLSSEINKSSSEIKKSSSEFNKKPPSQVQSSSSSVVSVSSSVASSTSPRRPKHAFLKKHEGVLSSIVSPEKRSPSLHQSTDGGRR